MNKRKLRYKRYFRDDQFPSCYGGVPKGRGGQLLTTNSLNLYGRLVHHSGWVLQAYG